MSLEALNPTSVFLLPNQIAHKDFGYLENVYPHVT